MYIFNPIGILVSFAVAFIADIGLYLAEIIKTGLKGERK